MEPRLRRVFSWEASLSLNITRRTALAAGLAAGASARALTQPSSGTTWESLARDYQTPDWFRDAKFGIWSHWGPQCQPENGDWYARKMYMQARDAWDQGETAYQHHLRVYGHPSETGFIDIIGKWKAERWDPAYLLRRFQKAGARYFMAMANHHDNLDLFASKHHTWNSVRVGPKRDIIGTWEKLVRQTDLKFAVSNHSSHAWHWWQTAYGYDAEGPMKGRRYDAYWLRKHHGKGKFWEGLDPQDLYTGPTYVPPKGIPTAKAMNEWHGKRDDQWFEDVPPERRWFAEQWVLRQNDLVDQYKPDMVYFDDTAIPFGQQGLDTVAQFYARQVEWHGRNQGVITAKHLSPLQKRAIVADVERSFVAGIQPQPWQTDTCIGSWHYDRRHYENDSYKSAKDVIQRLADVISKNGNLMLNIPMRGDGSIDDKEEKVIDGITAWFAVNSPAVYGTRPWRRFGEGPTKPPTGTMAEGQAKPFVAEDVRFTTKGGELFAFFMEWPKGEAVMNSLGHTALAGGRVERIALLGGGPVAFRQDADALRLTVPQRSDTGIVPVLRIQGSGLV
ncbi:MAG TPA: alpha-L-fucosidase [Sphingomicrobium sp.]